MRLSEFHVKPIVDQLVKTRHDLIPAFQHIAEVIKQGGIYHLVFKVYQHRRSLAQNSLMWVWNHEIAAWLTENTDIEVDQNDVHEFLCEQFWPKTINPLTKQGRRIETKKFTVFEMTEHLEKMELWAGKKEIPLSEPYDYNYARYGEKYA